MSRTQASPNGARHIPVRGGFPPRSLRRHLCLFAEGGQHHPQGSCFGRRSALILTSNEVPVRGAETEGVHMINRIRLMAVSLVALAALLLPAAADAMPKIRF